MKKLGICRHNLKKALLQLACVATIITPVAGVTADFPAKPVNLIVNYGPGGGTDLPARALSSAIPEFLGQSMIVTNKPGGGAQIGTAFAANARPDGYSMLISYGGLEQTFAPHIRKLPYKPLNGFTPITPISIYDCVILVNADAKWNTIEELIADAKQNPGSIKFGRSGTLGTNHVFQMLFKKETGVAMKVNIPLKGGSKTMSNLLGGHIDVAFLGHPISMEQFKAGKVRFLATAGAQRNAFTPEIPTLKELGYDIVLGNVKGIAVPSGTPDKVVEKLHDSIMKATQSKSFIKMMNSFNQPVVTMEQKEFAQFVQDEYDRWGKFIKEEGLGKK